MEPRFELQTTVNKDLMKQLAHYSLMKPRLRISRLLLLCIGLFELWLSSPASIAVGVIALLYALCYPMLIQWNYWRRNQPKAGTLYAYSFFDDRFTIVNGSLSQSAQYDDLFEVEETKEVFGLKRDKNGTVILPKPAFTTGSPEDFRAFIQEKTGKKIKFIR